MRRVLYAVTLSLAACSSGPDYGPWDPRPVAARESWDVRAQGRTVGRVVLLEVDDAEEPVRYYQVRNDAGQWVGYADAQLRFYQRVPFSMTEVFVGVHPMDQGLALLLEQRGAVELVPTGAAGAVEASGEPR